jgi:hypothetical protein
MFYVVMYSVRNTLNTVVSTFNIVKKAVENGWVLHQGVSLIGCRYICTVYCSTLHPGEIQNIPSPTRLCILCPGGAQIRYG